MHASPATFRPSRSKGQCFLRDVRVIERIVSELAPEPGETLLEIGGGGGELSLPLLRAGARLVTLESDDRLASTLAENIPAGGAERAEILRLDATRTDFVALVRERSSGPIRAFGNLPYSVAAPILLRLLSAAGSFRELTLMFQDEVASRLVAVPGTKAYGFLSVVAQQAADVRVLFRIPPEAFRPRPRVFSALVRFRLRHEEAETIGDEETFRWIVRGLLAHRRKTIANNIKHLKQSMRLRRAVEALSIDPRRRAETLTVAEFAALSRACARAP